MGRWRSAFSAGALRFEAPTWILTFIIYAGWVALTFCWNSLSIWIAGPLAAWLCAWHMSLQHELIHGHPTRNERINTVLAAAPLNLWLPYPLYRDEHRLHHRDAHLTDPLEDPESTYLSADAWRSAGPVRRWLLRSCNTLAGRMLIGPPLNVAQFWMRQARLISHGEAPWRVWLGHAIGVCLVLAWACVVCRIEFAAYIGWFVYGGTALSLIRSLAEHHAAELPGDRTAVVENAGLLGLLFLNNNLHLLHHAEPSIPWYALPAEWHATRTRLLADHRGPLYDGYLDVARRYGLRPHHAGPHPIGSPASRVECLE